MFKEGDIAVRKWICGDTFAFRVTRDHRGMVSGTDPSGFKVTFWGYDVTKATPEQRHNFFLMESNNWIGAK